MNVTITIVLAIAAFLLAAIDEWKAGGRSLTAWGVMALALIFILGDFIGR